MIQMMENHQFFGSDKEDPMKHVKMFIKLTETFRFNGVPTEAIRLQLFPFSLSGRATDWLESLANDSITTWEELMNLFLEKFYPPAKTSQMR